MIKAPPKSGTMFYNYKHSFSIVLLAVVDSSYCFTMVDIGSYGSAGDSTIFAESVFGQSLEQRSLGIPPPKELPGSQVVCPSVIVGDEAFPLKVNIMKPYPRGNLSVEQRIFNYRLSRARRVVENTFGILAARWRIFLRPIELKPGNVENTVKAAVCLHNYLKKKEPEDYAP